MSAIRRIADCNRTSAQVRKVPTCDMGSSKKKPPEGGFSIQTRTWWSKLLSFRFGRFGFFTFRCIIPILHAIHAAGTPTPLSVHLACRCFCGEDRIGNG